MKKTAWFWILVILGSPVLTDSLTAQIDSRGYGANYKVIFQEPDTNGDDIKCTFDVELEFGHKEPKSFRSGKYFVYLTWNVDRDSLRPSYTGGTQISKRLTIDLNNTSQSQNVRFRNNYVTMNKEFLNNILKPGRSHNLTVKGYVFSQSRRRNGPEFSTTIAYQSGRSTGRSDVTPSGGGAPPFQQTFAGVQISIPHPTHNDERLAQGSGTLKVGNYFQFSGDFRVKKGGIISISSLPGGGTGKWYWLTLNIKDFVWEFSANSNKLFVNNGQAEFSTRIKHTIDGPFVFDFLKNHVQSSSRCKININKLAFTNFATYGSGPWRIQFTGGQDPVSTLKVQYYNNGFGFCVLGKDQNPQYMRFIRQGFKYLTDDCK